MLTPEDSQPTLPRSTTLLLALIVGLIVANNYYVQPLLAEIAHTFHLGIPSAGLLAMVIQAGVACGMFLFVPLGDVVERRGLIGLLLLGCTAALACFALAPNPLCLCLAGFAVGATSACVHVVVPFAAHLAAPSQRGRVVGSVLGGLLFGILLARTFSGILGAFVGWRGVFWCASGTMLVLSLVVRLRLPASRPELALTWPALIRSAAALIRQHSALRQSALLGALLFCTFSAFWTTLVFLLATPPYHYSSTAAGLFGLVGAAGAAGAPYIGHLAQKHGSRLPITLSLALTWASFLIMGFLGRNLAGLICGVVLMDLGVQAGHVANQTRIYNIDPAARSRLNMVYMVSYFTGGGLGSLCGALAWHHAGWPGVCVFSLVILAGALAFHLTRTELAAPSPAGELASA